MNRTYAYDLLPSGNLFSELVDFADPGYFDDESRGDSGQQACHVMKTRLWEEPPEFGEFHQEKTDESGVSPHFKPRMCGDSWQIEPLEQGDSPQKEAGEYGDFPQKPPECGDLRQEEAWVQSPSPLISLPSLPPTSTYMILTMTGVPLTDPNEPKLPEETAITPQIINTSPQMIAVLPQMTAVSPQMTVVSPQMTAMLPQMIAVSPQIIAMSPQIIAVLPQMTAVSPQVIAVSPQMTAVSPQTISISPQVTGKPPQETPSPLPMLHTKPRVKSRKSFEIALKNKYPCDFQNCNKVFTNSKLFREHIRTHRKPFVCMVNGCKWRFARASTFSRHMRKHSASKPLRCRYCDRCFSRSDHLRIHETRQKCVVRRSL